MENTLYILVIIFVFAPVVGAWLSDGESYEEMEKIFKDFSFKRLYKEITELLSEIPVRRWAYLPILIITYIVYLIGYALGIIFSGYLYIVIWKILKFFIWKPLKWIFVKSDK